MKRLFFLICIVFMMASVPASAAQKVKVAALTPFNSINPVNKMKVITLERVEFNNGIVFEDGTVIYGEIFDVKQPKRAKLNASFKFKPTSYMYNGKTYTVNDPNFIAKYAEYKELDKAALATSAATTAGGLIFHIPLLSEGVSLVKGMWKDPENNRLKSGVVQVYKDSIFSYVEEGKDVVIDENTMFLLKFKSSDYEDLDTESSTEETSEEPAPKQPEALPKDEEAATVPVVPPVVPDTGKFEVRHIETVSPDEVLHEVELNTK